MALIAFDLSWIRDEIGDATPPSDADLGLSYDDMGNRILVAIRILKRRRAGLAGGGVQSLTIPGAVSVTLRSDLASLDRQITRLEAQYEAETGEVLPEAESATTGRMSRVTAR